jgi:hypothetical protein
MRHLCWSRLTPATWHAGAARRKPLMYPSKDAVRSVCAAIAHNSPCTTPLMLQIRACRAAYELEHTWLSSNVSGAMQPTQDPTDYLLCATVTTAWMSHTVAYFTSASHLHTSTASVPCSCMLTSAFQTTKAHTISWSMMATWVRFGSMQNSTELVAHRLWVHNMLNPAERRMLGRRLWRA